MEAATARGERRWPMAVAVLVAIALQVGTPHRGQLPGWWVFPVLEFVLLVVMIARDPGRIDATSRAARRVTIALIVVMTGGVIFAAGRLIYEILDGQDLTAGDLLGRGAAVWVANVIVFSLWYWEFDRGGPVARARDDDAPASFAFPENATPELAAPDWFPRYPDYLYLAFTNATAFSPTDTLPVRTWAKMLMMVQAVTSLVHRGARDRSGDQRPMTEEARNTPRWVELVELTVLALVAIATAWSGYQATTWGGRQSQLYGQASSTRFQADAAATLGGQELAADASMFTAWLQARDAGNRSLQTELERRFTPDYAGAFEQWLATDPFTNADAPPGPAAMPGYTNPGLAKADQLNAQASADFTAGTDARETANRYARDTVLLATVIFFVATAQRFTRRGIRLAANAIALGLLLYTLSTLVTLPRA